MTPPRDTTTNPAPTAPARRPSNRALGSGLVVLLALLLLLAYAMASMVERDSSGSGDAVASAVRDNRFQAVFMSNDRVYFGRVRAREGSWIELQDAFFARERPAAEGERGDAAGGQEVVSASVEVGGDGDLLLNADEVVLVQDLASDSDYAEAIEDALE